jgi:predicted nucleic acid-binding Zn ribbon protein
MMRCPACKKNIPFEAESCPQCGHLITKTDRQKERKARIVAGIGILVAFGFLAFMFVMGHYSSSDTPPDILVETHSEPEQDYTKYGAQVERFLDQIREHSQVADNAANKFMTSFQEMSEGYGDANTTYALAKDAKAKADLAYYELSTASFPDLPLELKGILRSGCSELTTYYHIKSKAFEAAMDFLDTRRVSTLEEFEQKNDEAQAFWLRGDAKLTRAKMKAGLIETP